MTVHSEESNRSVIRGKEETNTKEEEYNNNGPTTRSQRKITRELYQELKMATMCEKDEVRNKEYVLLVTLKDKKQNKKDGNKINFIVALA